MNQKRRDGKWKGVRFDAVAAKYLGAITINSKTFSSRRVDSQMEAAEEYDKLAVTHHGEFASLNFPVYK